jgi:hypothetical protein
LGFFCMSVKEIRELEDEIKEVTDIGESGAKSREVENEGGWEERDFVSESEDVEEVEKEEKFSIGDTMLARGEEREEWSSGSLEDEVDWDEVESFGDDEEEFGGEGFSYESVGQGGSGDLYGAVSSGSDGDLYGAGAGGGAGDLYGAGGSSGGSGNLYGAGGGGNSVSMYNTSGDASQSESSLYATGSVGGGKKGGGMTYNVEGPKKKSGGKRRGKMGGLETGMGGVRKARKGVSMM